MLNTLQDLKDSSGQSKRSVVSCKKLPQLFTKQKQKSRNTVKVQFTWTLTTHSDSCICFKNTISDDFKFSSRLFSDHMLEGIFWWWRRASISISLIIYNRGAEMRKKEVAPKERVSHGKASKVDEKGSNADMHLFSDSFPLSSPAF